MISNGDMHQKLEQYAVDTMREWGIDPALYFFEDISFKDESAQICLHHLSNDPKLPYADKTLQFTSVYYDGNTGEITQGCSPTLY
jgi:hypothetical protein